MKSVLITGAARGLGASLASASVEAGFSVIATVRDPGKIDTQLKVRAEALDLADTESLHVLTDQLIKEECVIDLLINNAGMNPKDRSTNTSIQAFVSNTFRLLTSPNRFTLTL